jgi:DDE superfamily endonuclease
MPPPLPPISSVPSSAARSAARHWRPGDPDILIVCDAGYDVTRLAFVLADLPVELLGRLRSDRVLRLPTPPRRSPQGGRPPKHGPEFALDTPATWAQPQTTTTTQTTRYGTATAPQWPAAGTGCIPGSPTAPAGWTTTASCPSSRAR